MAELVDALISGVSGETRADSNSVVRTIEERLNKPFFCYILRIKALMNIIVFSAFFSDPVSFSRPFFFHACIVTSLLSRTARYSSYLSGYHGSLLP